MSDDREAAATSRSRDGAHVADTADAAMRRRINRQAVWIVASVAPFGLVYGATAATAGLSLAEAAGLSLFAFGGAAQFAAVEILGDGGSPVSAAIAGLLLNVRFLAFGVVMAPALAGVWWRRAALSHLMIDEPAAVGSMQDEQRWQRYGYLVTGLGVVFIWNSTTVFGYALFSGAADLIDDLGLDVAGPAAFLALLWPRLSRRPQLVAAISGALIAVALLPFVPAGLPILAAMFGVLVARVDHSRRRAS